MHIRIIPCTVWENQSADEILSADILRYHGLQDLNTRVSALKQLYEAPPLQYRLSTPELQWQPRGERRISQGLVSIRRRHQALHRRHQAQPGGEDALFQPQVHN